MEEFMKEAFRVEKDLVRLAYWLSALEWGHHSLYVEEKAKRARSAMDDAISALQSLRSEIRQEEE